MAKKRDSERIYWWVCLELSLLIIFTWFTACLVLAIIRVMFPTTLLFDQFCLLTVLVLVLSYYLIQRHGKFFSKSLNLFSTEAKFFVSATVALLFFSTVQYSVLAVDRSRSLYIFSWVDEGIIKSIDGQILVTSDAVDPVGLADTAAIDQRIKEQTSRGLMFNEGSTVKLTFFGKVLLLTSKFFASVFNLRGWYTHT